MNNCHTFFPRVRDYYASLSARLETAREAISMTYLAFEDGQWAGRMAGILRTKAAAGLRVRLMVDKLGQLTDDPRHMLHSREILHALRKAGVQVDVFHPVGRGLSIRNRMHCKFCAIDGETAFLGGSNIGDYYTQWSDSNLRLDGALGSTLHDLYDFLRSFSRGGISGQPALDPSKLWVGGDRLWLTLPSRRLDVRRALLDLILGADRSIHLRTWYFLPDAEILNALCTQAENGVQVNVLLSHRTRVRPVDLANCIHIHRLACAGGHIYRYTGSYMHAKVSWNDHGQVLFGSANLDPHSMEINFESCLQIHDGDLARRLLQVFERDVHTSPPQTPEVYRRRSLPGKLLSQACNLAAPWL